MEKCEFLGCPQVEQGQALGADGLSLELKLQSAQAVPAVVAAHKKRMKWKHSWVYQTESCGHPWVDRVCQILGVEWPVKGVEETMNGD